MALASRFRLIALSVVNCGAQYQIMEEMFDKLNLSKFLLFLYIFSLSIIPSYGKLLIIANIFSFF